MRGLLHLEERHLPPRFRLRLQRVGPMARSKDEIAWQRADMRRRTRSAQKVQDALVTIQAWAYLAAAAGVGYATGSFFAGLGTFVLLVFWHARRRAQGRVA